MDPEVLKSEFNITMKDLWSVQCKFYDLGGTFQSQCLPCLIFTPPDYWNLTTETVSNQDESILYIKLHNQTYLNSVQQLKFNIKGKSNDFAVLFQLHEKNQSTVFENEVDLGKSSFFRFKPGFKG